MTAVIVLRDDEKIGSTTVVMKIEAIQEAENILIAVIHLVIVMTEDPMEEGITIATIPRTGIRTENSEMVMIRPVANFLAVTVDRIDTASPVAILMRTKILRPRDMRPLIQKTTKGWR